MHSTRCSHCGVHFEGEAFQYTWGAAETPPRVGGHRALFSLAVVVAIAVFFMYLLAR